MRSAAIRSVDAGESDGPAMLPVYRGARVVARRERRWSGVSALYLDLRSDGSFEGELQSPVPCLLFTVEASGGVQVSVVSGRPSTVRHRAGPLSLTTAGMPVAIRGRLRYFRQLVLAFDEGVLRRRHAGLDLSVAFRPRLMFADGCAQHLCQMLADDCLPTGPMGASLGDSLIHSLLLALSAGAEESVPAMGGLAPWQLRRLEDFVESRLGVDLSLDRLAQEVGVSRSHFGRAFKQATGQSPFEWLRAKRVERAKEMLAEGGMPVAEVAIATGFADQAHLTRVFGRSVGVPPGLWQRTRRSRAGEHAAAPCN